MSYPNGTTLLLRRPGLGRLVCGVPCRMKTTCLVNRHGIRYSGISRGRHGGCLRLNHKTARLVILIGYQDMSDTVLVRKESSADSFGAIVYVQLYIRQEPHICRTLGNTPSDRGHMGPKTQCIRQKPEIISQKSERHCA